MPKPARTVGKYKLLSLIGKGGMGEVWRAYQRDLDRHVALKLMIAGEHASPSSIERFKREAQLAAKLNHKAIVKVFDVGNDGALHYIVMELVEGQSLDRILPTKKLSTAHALKIARSVAEALSAAHAQGIVHRDVKPGNIIIDGDGRVRVADFGLAKHADQGSLTDAGAILGTPDYMAPEQAFGDPAEVTERADLYGLGAVLYEMLTGRPPLTGATPLAVLRKLEEEDPLPPSRHNPEISREVDALVLKALEKDPARRQASARALADQLTALTGKRASAESDKIPSLRIRVPREVRRSSSPAPLGAAIAAIVILGLVAFVLVARNKTPAPVDEPPPPPAPVELAPPAPKPAPLPRPIAAPPPPVEEEPAPVDTSVPGPEPTRPPEPAPVAAPPVAPAPSAPAQDPIARARALEADADAAKDAATRRAALEQAFGLLPPGGERAEVARRLGRFARAASEPASKETTIRGFVDRLAAHPLRWASFGVREVLTKKELDDAEASLAAPDQFLAAALTRLHAGLPADAALEKLAAAANAPRRELAFLRAEVQLHRFAREHDASALDAASKELDQALEATPRAWDLLGQKVVVLLEANDAAGAKAASDRLLEEAPSGETYLLRAYLHARAHRWSEARDNLDTAKRLDASLDTTAFAALCDVNRVLLSPEKEKFGADEQKRLLDRLARDESPLGALLRAFLHGIRAGWKEEERELRKLGDTGKGALLERPELRAFAASAGSPPLEIAASAAALAALARPNEAMAATRQALRHSSEIQEGDRRRDFERDELRSLARLNVGRNYDEAIADLDQAFQRGLKVEEVRADPAFAPLKDSFGFESLLRKYGP
jgi:serine/threonine protein kinase